VGQPEKPLSPERGPDHLWGCELREWRKRRGMSVADLGSQVHCDGSQVAKIERATRRATLEFAEACDQVLDTEGALVRLHRAFLTSRGDVANPAVNVAAAAPAMAATDPAQGSSDDEGISVPCRLRDGRVAFVTVPRRDFLRSGASLGALAALGLGIPANSGLPSRPQRVRPAEGSAYGPTPIERLRKLRQVLIDSDNLMGPRLALTAVRDQIRTIQELRADTGGADRRQLLELQTEYAELASWLFQDLGEHQAASYWLDRALQWSHTVGDSDLTAFVMARKSQLAGEMRDLVDVVDLAEASRHMTNPQSRLGAVGLTYQAFGHALRGETAASERAFDQARDLVENLHSPPGPWGVWLDASYINVHRAQGLHALGRHAEAATAFTQAIGHLPEGYHRDRGVYLARAAVAHAGAGAPEQAAATGMQALAIAEDTGSGRILHGLAELDDALARWRQMPPVTDFHATFDSMILHENPETPTS
jgi:transcriptional regulator with XRE-family HTH domain/tetratricopeptide (TPR) repeat protein